MDVQELFRHDLERLSTHIADLSKELDEKITQDIERGDELELKVYSKQHALLLDLCNNATDLDSGIAYCRARLIAVEQRHQHLISSGQAHDIAHADQWWETETEREYWSECLVKLETARAKS